MKIMLVCAAGMSTSIVMKKIRDYSMSNQLEVEVEAFGKEEYLENCNKYDVILLGPQISYHKDSIAKESGKPCDVIPPMDYATANAENIIKKCNSLLNK